MIFLVGIVVPDANDGNQGVAGAKESIKDEQKEESLILEAHAIVGEWAMMAHLEDAGFTYRAVMSSGRFKLIALGAFPIPKAVEVFHGLGAVLHEPFHVLLKALKSIIFLGLLDGFSFFVEADLSSLSAISVLDLSSEVLVGDQVFRSTRLYHHRPEVVEHDVIKKRETYRYPY